jgi:ATP adenylyltransferase
MSYIQGTCEKSGRCVFCVENERSEDEERFILFRGERAFVIMNRFPYTNGHLMVAPFRHTAKMEDLADDEALEMHHLLVMSKGVLQDCFAPHGFNLGMNLGQVAGAGIADHLHLHIVPRWSGDTNFMPVFGEVRVIPQHLEETYGILLRSFAGRHP